MPSHFAEFETGVTIIRPFVFAGSDQTRIKQALDIQVPIVLVRQAVMLVSSRQREQQFQRLHQRRRLCPDHVRFPILSNSGE